MLPNSFTEYICFCVQILLVLTVIIREENVWYWVDHTNKDVICSTCIITAPSSRKPGDPLVISDIKKGSVAHR